MTWQASIDEPVLSRTRATMDGTQGDRPIRPTLFIGLGGTGLKVLARLRGRMYERFGNPDRFPIYGFLGIDSNSNDLEMGGVEESRGVPVKEYVDIGISAQQANHVRRELAGRYAHIAKWLSPDISSVQTIHYNAGAGQIRNLGRLLFVHKIEDVKTAIVRVAERITNTDSIQAARAAGAQLEAVSADGLDVVLVSSLAGGTGAGGVIDCAYLCRLLSRDSNIRSIRAYLCLPDVFFKVLPSNEVQRIYANGYAALREIEFLNRHVMTRPFDTSAWGDFAERRRIDQQPFDICYLISRKKQGGGVASHGEIYDMIADALSFSVGGSALDKALRGTWINASSSYRWGLHYRILATDKERGGPEDKINNSEQQDAYVYFQHSWSTQFSSIGLSTITLKVPELRRLAAARLLRRLLQIEMGPMEASNFNRKVAGENSVKRINSNTDFLLEWRKNVDDAVVQLVHTATTANAVFNNSKGLLRQIDDVAKVVEAGDVSNVVLKEETRDKVRPVTSRMLALAAENAQKIVQELTSVAQRQSSRRRTLDLLQESAQQLKDNYLVKFPGARPQPDASPVWLTNWKDLDEKVTGDWTGLRETAREVLRIKARDWLSGWTEKYHDFCNEWLTRRYREQAHELLVAKAAEVGKEIEDLMDLSRALESAQNDLANAFTGDREQVLTRSIAAHAGDDIAESGLDQQIEISLSERAADADLLAWARATLLTAVKNRLKLAFSPENLLQVKKSLGARSSEVVNSLLDITAAEILDQFPKSRNIMEHIRGLGSDFSQKILPDAFMRARAHWPLNNADPELLRPIHNYRFFGAQDLRDDPYYQQNIRRPIDRLESEKNEKWQFCASGADPASLQEIVLVHEAHGFGLPTMSTIAELRDSYAKCQREGDVLNRHLDCSMITILPEFSGVEEPIARKIVESWDIALLAVLLEKVKWSPEQGTFHYSANTYMPIPVGSSVESIGSWLRTPTTIEHALRLQQSIQADLDRMVGEVETGDPDKAMTSLRVMTVIDLALELLGNHVFKPEPTAMRNAYRYPPTHVMIRRIRNTRVNNVMDVIRQAITVETERNVREELMREMHLRLKFVGPTALEGDMSESGEFAGLAPPRLVVLTEKRKDDRSTLDEAFRLRWFPDVKSSSQLTSLFPGAVKQAEMGSLDVSRLAK